MSVRYPRIIAHRGGGGLAPENTLAGIARAADIGCRGVEFDVMLSADGVPVLMHDETLDRTTSGSGPVAAYRLEALRALDAGGEPVPTLAEALDLCRHRRLWVNVEIKPSAGRDEETGRAVAYLLASLWEGHGVVSSFSESALVAAQEAARNLAYALLVERVPADWRVRLQNLGCIALHCAATAFDTLAEAASRDCPLACYTVNDRLAAERLLARGAAAVFTDRPDRWRPDEMR